jgi:hypothetical protein
MIDRANMLGERLGEVMRLTLSSCPDLIRASIPFPFRANEVDAEWIAGSSPAMTTNEEDGAA